MARRLGSARRVLLIDPDLSGAASAVEALRASGIEATAVADAETGLRTLAASEPDVLVIELELQGRDGRWLLRRLRDDFMGARPQVVLYTRPQAMTGGIADFGADAVVIKPASPSAIVAAATPVSDADRARQLERLRELINLSLLESEMEGALNTLAKRLALTYRVSECIVVAQVGDRQCTGVARGPEETEWDDQIWERCQAALDAGVPMLATDAKGRVTTFLGVPMAMPGGLQLGFIVLMNEGARMFPLEAMDHLRLLGQRLHGELAWRSVHERIAADRDRLRESSMLDPMLPGVWSRSALDQTLPGEVSASLRRKEPMSFAILDLKGLRHLNERFGHLVGDEALRHVASLVRGSLRTQDLVARYSGDTFAVVLGGTPLPDARHVVERIQDTVTTTPLMQGEDVIPLVVTAGLAPLLGNDDSGEAALQRASAVLKLAKRRREPLLVAEGLEVADAAGASLPASEGLVVGTTLGGMYQILHEISRGAMGVVYRAEDLGLGRPVALKTLRPDLARDRNFVDRFRAEAATLAALRHENLVQVYAFGIDGEDVYFVMELVEGEPLEDRVELARQEGKQMPFDEVARIITQVASALDFMHHAGILHRDVKPANVLLDRVRERAVLVDVGIAKRRGSPTDPAGTPGFTAPESFTGATEGSQADVYGLAATAYTVLSTDVPFRGGSVDEILRSQMNTGPQPASSIRPALSPAVDAVLQRSLDPDPARRHASAGDFARALEEALRDGTGKTPVPTELRKVDVPAPQSDGTTAVIPVDEDRIDVVTAVRSQPLSPAALESSSPVRKVSRSGPVPVAIGSEASSGIVLEAISEISEALRAPANMLPSLREPELPAPGTPHTRGILFRSSYRVLGARHGAAWVAHVSRRHPALAQALQPQSTLLSWHPTELFVVMLQAIAQSGRDAKAFARELGRVATAATFSRFFGANPAALSPWRLLSTAEHFWRRYHTWGAVTVERDGEQGARVCITGGPREPLVCACTRGILEQVVTLSGASHGDVLHPRCEAAGDPVCEFVVRWTARPA